MRARVALVLVSSAALACASSGSSTAETRPTSGNPNVLTRSEIQQASGVATAFDAVNRLRPRFLRVTGPKSTREVDNGPVVKLDESPFTELNALRTIDANLVREVRYYSAIDATQRFGGLTARPVIHVITTTTGPRDRAAAPAGTPAARA